MKCSNRKSNLTEMLKQILLSATFLFVSREIRIVILLERSRPFDVRLRLFLTFGALGQPNFQSKARRLRGEKYRLHGKAEILVLIRG